jgi:hypothetical protein
MTFLRLLAVISSLVFCNPLHAALITQTFDTDINIAIDDTLGLFEVNYSDALLIDTYNPFDTSLGQLVGVEYSSRIDFISHSDYYRAKDLAACDESLPFSCWPLVNAATLVTNPVDDDWLIGGGGDQAYFGYQPWVDPEGEFSVTVAQSW